MMNLLETLNRAWFLSLNAQPGAPGWLMTFATVCAQYLLYVIPVILLAYWFLGEKPGTERHFSHWPRFWLRWDSVLSALFSTSILAPL